LNEIYKLNNYKYVKLVPTFKLDNEQEVNNQLYKYLEQNYEGQILRLDGLYENKRSKSLLKHKEFQTEEFNIISVTEGVGKLTNKAGTFQIQTNEGVNVDVTINGTHEFLADLWKRKDELIGKECTVRYFGYTEDGSLRFPKCIDINRWEFE
jgi:DNA ligase-1